MSKSFGIITDSGADFSLEYMKENDLILIRTRIMIGEDEYIDRENITREDIIDKMINEKAKASTSVAPPYEFEEVIKNALEKYGKVLFISISSKMSATLQNALMTAKRLKTDDFIAIDTESVSWGMTLLIDHAIRRRNQGIPIETVKDELMEMKDNLQLYFMVETLEYLRRGGRIGAAKSLLGTLMGLKPVLTVIDSQITSAGTVKSFSEGMEFFEEKIDENSKKFKKYVLVLIYGLKNPEFKKFAESIKEKYEALKCTIEPIGANIICHAGPYLYGFGIVKIPDSALDAYN